MCCWLISTFAKYMQVRRHWYYGLDSVKCKIILKWRSETHITLILIEKCPVGYSNLGNEPLSPYCYKDIDETLSWERSRKVCLLHGGDLATIHSKAETQAISERFKGHWLGYKAGKGKFNDCCKWLRGNLVLIPM